MAQAVTARPSTPAIRQTRLLINNEWVDPVEGGTFETYNPATGEVIARGRRGDRRRRRSRRSRPRAGARNPGPGARWTPPTAAGSSTSWPTWSSRTPRSSPRSNRSTAARRSPTRAATCKAVVNTLRYYAGWADKIEGRTVPVRGSFLSYTLRQPVGVVGQIIPWNFPLLMLAWKWGPALACGNTVVMKPAEQTPLTALRVGELAIEAGFPAGVINIINGFGETAGAALVAHPDVDKIAFTGHVDTAKIIQKPGGRHAQAHDLRAGRQEPERHLRRRRPGRRRRRRLPRHLLPRRPVLHRRQPAVRRGEDPPGVRRAARREGQGRAGSATRSTPRPSKARRSRRSSSTRSSATSTSARSRAPSS